MRDYFTTAASPLARMFATRRASALFLAVALSALATATAGAAAVPVETFVSQNVDKGLQILNDRQSGPAERASRFQSFLENLTDINRIGRFTLGAARRTASPADVSAFDAAFRNYTIAVYQSRLGQYAGQSLKVTGSTERAPSDYVVSTVLVDPSGKSNQQPLEVDFRVLSDKGRMMVVDVSIAGVWLAIEERDQFSAFLSQHNGNIPALAAHLDQLTAQMKNGGSATGGRAANGH